jgi:hypothetical protein
VAARFGAVGAGLVPDLLRDGPVSA